MGTGMLTNILGLSGHLSNKVTQNSFQQLDIDGSL